MITSFRSEVDTFENEYRIRIQHFSIDTFLSFNTFDNPGQRQSNKINNTSGEEEKGAVMVGTDELVCEQASISSNITTFHAQMIVVARYTLYH